jgi:hypothetical protein
MNFTAEQYSFVAPNTRLFKMNATMKGLPVDVFHSYVGSEARMRVKVLSVYPMVDASGVDFTTAETVTLFNDLCVMAPSALIGANVTWESLDEHTLLGTYTNERHTVHAKLFFDDSGALVNFTSDDRPELAQDGKTFVPRRWSTPLKAYRTYGEFKLASHGDARYAATTGEYTYGEFDIQEIEYNVVP